MVFARFHLNGPETSAQAVPVHTSGSGSDGVTVSPFRHLLPFVAIAGETSFP
jgi:hypothetical protein